MAGGLIQRGDILARLAKALGVKDKSPSPTLDSVVQPVILVGDSRDEPLGTVERSFFGYEVFTGAAGQFSAIECLNPANSGIDVFVDYCLLSAAGVSVTDWRKTTQVLANLTTKATQYRDIIAGQPVAEIRAESLAATVLGASSVRHLANVTLIVPLDVRLPPGVALAFFSQQVASTLVVSFYGREIQKPFAR